MGKIKEILIVSHTHHDIGYTHLPGLAMNMHQRAIGRALDLCEQDSDDADPAALRWTVEISHPLLKFLQQAETRDVKRLQDLVARGRISITAAYAHMTQLVGHEEYVRFLLPVRELRQRYGLPVSIVQHGDINGLSWGFVPLMQQAGLDTLVMALNPDHGRAPFEQPSAFWWEGQDGSRVLVWLSVFYNLGGFVWGLAEGTIDKAREPIAARVARLQERDDYPFDFLLAHSADDNMLPNGKQSLAVRQWNEEKNYPPMRLVTIDQAMARARQQTAQVDMPVWRGEWADWWAHGHASSADELAIGRQAPVDLRRAETFRALAWLADPGTIGQVPANEGPVLNWYRSGGVLPSGKRWQARLDEAWENMLLFQEHTWGTFETVTAPHSMFTRLHWQQKVAFAANAAGEARDLAREALANLTCALPPAAELALVAANPLSEPRDELVYMRTPSQDHWLLVRDVPALGVRAVLWDKFSADLNPPAPVAIEEATVVLENSFYRLEIDPASASIRSLRDKQLDREWVDSAALSGIGGVVYEETDPADTHPAVSKHRSYFHPDTPGPAFKRTAAQGTGCAMRAHKSFCESISVSASAPYLPGISTRFTLYSDLPYIDVEVTLDKLENYGLEGVFVLFPFAIEAPRFLLETANAVYEAGAEQLPDSCPDYYSIQHGAAVTDGTVSVLWATREAPLVQLGGFHSGEWNSSLEDERGHIYAWLMNNLYFTNFKAAQGGHSSYGFRFSTVSGAVTVGQVRRFGTNFATPPLARLAPVEPGSYSWLAVEPQSVEVQVIKAALEEPDAMIMRVKELAGQPTTATVRWNGPGELVLAESTILEDVVGPKVAGDGRVFTLELRPHELHTIKIAKS